MAKNDKDQNKKKGHFFKDMKAELKKVVWPTAKQTANNTVAVIAFTLAVALIVFVLDLCFDAIHKNAIIPLQEKVTSSYNTTTNNAVTDNTTTDENTSSAEATNTETSNATNATAEVTENTESSAETNTESQE